MLKSIYLCLSAIALIFIAKLDTYGLYLFIAIFWIISAFQKKLTNIAICSIIIFMGGFALMRIFKIVMGDSYDLYSFVILIGEILIALLGIWLVSHKKSNN